MACHGLRKMATVYSGAFSPAGEPHHAWVLELPDRGQILGRVVLPCPAQMKKQFARQSWTSRISFSFRVSCRPLWGLPLQKLKIMDFNIHILESIGG
jgi:hypothetical protein